MSPDATFAVAAKPGGEKIFAPAGLMQHHVAPGSQHRTTGTRLLRLAGADRLAQRDHGSGQIEVPRLLGEHRQALQDTGCGRMPSRLG